MRVALVLLSVVSSGCFFPTPLISARTVPAGETRIEAGFGMPAQPTVRVRHGVTTRVEVGARAVAVGFAETAGATLGIDGAVQLLSPESSRGVGVLGSLGVSRTVLLSGAFGEGIGTSYLYPAVAVGTDHVYGGLRALVPLDAAGDGALGGFVGWRRDALGGRATVGWEVAAYRFERDGVFPVHGSVAVGLTL